MDRKQMLRALEKQADAYRQFCPSTAEMDIVIFRSFCSGKSAVRIAMDTPCAESAVYRAIRRVKDYLNVPEEIPFMEILRKHIAENVPVFGDWNAQSVLEMLYVAYSEYNRYESEDSKSGFNTLYEKLSELPLKHLDKIIDVVADLCHFHERDGFTEGVKLGIRLGDELSL